MFIHPAFKILVFFGLVLSTEKVFSQTTTPSPTHTAPPRPSVENVQLRNPPRAAVTPSAARPWLQPAREGVLDERTVFPPQERIAMEMLFPHESFQWIRFTVMPERVGAPVYQSPQMHPNPNGSVPLTPNAVGPWVPSPQNPTPTANQRSIYGWEWSPRLALRQCRLNENFTNQCAAILDFNESEYLSLMGRMQIPNPPTHAVAQRICRRQWITEWLDGTTEDSPIEATSSLTTCTLIPGTTPDGTFVVEQPPAGMPAQEWMRLVHLAHAASEVRGLRIIGARVSAYAFRVAVGMLINSVATTEAVIADGTTRLASATAADAGSPNAGASSTEAVEHSATGEPVRPLPAAPPPPLLPTQAAVPAVPLGTRLRAVGSAVVGHARNLVTPQNLMLLGADHLMRAPLEAPISRMHTGAQEEEAVQRLRFPGVQDYFNRMIVRPGRSWEALQEQWRDTQYVGMGPSVTPTGLSLAFQTLVAQRRPERTTRIAADPGVRDAAASVAGEVRRTVNEVCDPFRGPARFVVTHVRGAVEFLQANRQLIQAGLAARPNGQRFLITIQDPRGHDDVCRIDYPVGHDTNPATQDQILRVVMETRTTGCSQYPPGENIIVAPDTILCRPRINQPCR